MKKLFGSAILLLACLFNNAFAEENTIFESVVKVNNGGKTWGTGTCINIDKDYIYILTNRHVVGTSKEVSVQFYRQGHQSVSIPAKVIWTAYKRNEPVDIGLLTVSRTNLDWTPTIVKFEFDDTLLKVNDTCLTIGCPEAQWPRAYKGHIVGVNGGTYIITPTVVPGQSGSVLFNGDGTKAIGLIAWYEGDYGKAMTAEVIQKAALGNHSNYFLKQPYEFQDSERKPIPVDFGYSEYSDCGPFSCKPKNERQPLLNRPKNPDGPLNRNPKVEPSNPGDGIKIFPTYPGDNGDEFTPKENDPVTPGNIHPTPPQDDLSPRIAKIEDRVTNLEKSNEDLTKKVTDMNISVTDLSIKIGNLQNNLPKKVTDIENRIDNKADKEEIKDLVTPGKLKEFLDSNKEEVNKTIEELKTNIVPPEEINNIAQGLNNTVNDKIKVEVDKLSDKVDKAIIDQSSTSTKVLTDLITVITTKPKEVSNSEVTNNTYHDLSQTAVSTGIPTGAALLIGYWIKKLLGKIAADYLKSRFGGSAPTAPFQTPGITK